MIIHGFAERVQLSRNSLNGSIPSEIALLTALCKYILVLTVVVSYLDSHAFLVIAFDSTASLGLFATGLKGSIPSEIGFLSKLSESLPVWCLP